MPAISRQYDPAVGPCVEVGLLPAGPITDTPPPDIPRFNALMDTGASHTCISPTAVESLRLIPVGKRLVNGVTGPAHVNIYSVNVLLFFGADVMLQHESDIAEFQTVSPLYDVLIGRDIICNGVFTMDFTGRFTFAI